MRQARTGVALLESLFFLLKVQVFLLLCILDGVVYSQPVVLVKSYWWGVGFTLSDSFTLLLMCHVCCSTAPLQFKLYHLYLTLYCSFPLSFVWPTTKWGYFFTCKYLAMHKSLKRYEHLSFFISHSVDCVLLLSGPDSCALFDRTAGVWTLQGTQSSSLVFGTVVQSKITCGELWWSLHPVKYPQHPVQCRESPCGYDVA